MEINVREMHRAILMEISGRIDSTNATELGEALNEQIDAGHYSLVADMSKVEYISSAGLRELVAALKRVKQTNGDLRLTSLSERVREVFNIAGLDAIFQIFNSQVDAVGSF
jgi:anti-sigma B factor antagonist